MIALKIIALTILGTVVQVAAVVLAFVVANSYGADFPLLAVMYCYLPTILLVQKFGNFVGCANLVEPFLLGVPSGAIFYSFVASCLFTVARRRRVSS